MNAVKILTADMTGANFNLLPQNIQWMVINNNAAGIKAAAKEHPEEHVRNECSKIKWVPLA
ncbi:hypothetical protein KBC03_06635 [Patescibacteria group bacterium]|nr:hypothetical protein [Patescibacteria group bacterium]